MSRGRAILGCVLGRVHRRGALVLMLQLCGCPPPPPASKFPDGAAALARMKDTYACANGIKGEGKIDYLGAEGRVRGDVLMFAVNPARVRVDVISSFGAMLFSLTSNGKAFKMLDLKENRFLYGPAKACNLARMTRIPIPGHVLVSLLRGEASLLKHEPSASTLLWDDGHYVVQVPSTHGARQEIHLEVYDEDWIKSWERQRVRVTEVLTFKNEVELYTASLSDHEPAKTAAERVDPTGLSPTILPSGGRCDVEVPRTIRMKVPHSGDDVVFSYEKVAFNPPIPARAFTQVAPPGIKKVFADCQD